MCSILIMRKTNHEHIAGDFVNIREDGIDWGESCAPGKPKNRVFAVIDVPDLPVGHGRRFLRQSHKRGTRPDRPEQDKRHRYSIDLSALPRVARERLRVSQRVTIMKKQFLPIIIDKGTKVVGRRRSV